MSRSIFDFSSLCRVAITLITGTIGLVTQPLLAQMQLETAKIPIKVVVVSMFEHGELSGDRPGEFQFWVERLPLAKQLDFPLVPYPLRMN